MPANDFVPSACAHTEPGLAVRGPRGLLQAIPYLLGFHPDDSLVLVGVRDNAVCVTARLGLDDVARDAVLEHAVGVLVRAGSSVAFAAVYDDADVDPDRSLPWSALVPVVRDAATQEGCVLLDMFLVARGRWWSYACDGPACCPDSGGTVADPPASFLASATAAGMSALPDRAALGAVLDAPPGTDPHALSPLIAAAENAAVAAVLNDSRDRFDRALTRSVFSAARRADAKGARVTDDTAARFAAALTDTAIRDSVWIAIDSGRLDGRTLWADLSRRLPAPYDAAPLFLYGWSCWRHGDGASAGIAASRALASDPEYTAADLLHAALASGLDPRRTPRLRRAQGRLR